MGSIPGEGNGNPLPYSCLGNPVDRGALWATAHGVAESDTTEQLNNNNSNNSIIMSLSVRCRGRQKEEMGGGEGEF